jgi:hypothetical protein
MTYKVIIEDVVKCPLYKKYYEVLHNNDLIDVGDYAEVIEKLMQLYAKDTSANTLLNDIEEISKVRCAHIIFTFLLGLFIYKQSEPIKSAIEKTTERLLTNAGHPNDFPFLWFLICLFHDLGYSEENKQQNSRIRVDWVNNQKKLAAFDGVPELYSKIYRQYFLYRKIEHGKTDHGIYAGLKMFKILCNIRKKHTDNSKGGWKKELEDLYNLASWVVLVHNMYFTKDTQLETCALYKKYSLDELILETEGGSIKNYPIKLSEYPVLFLFCLVDLIEPMKRIEKIECCDEINFEIKDDKLEISSKLECACIKKYFKDIADAKDWFADVKFDDKNKRIEIPVG